MTKQRYSREQVAVAETEYLTVLELLVGLERRSPEERGAACEKLGTLTPRACKGVREVLRVLAAHLSDDDDRVVWSAAKAIMRIDSKGATRLVLSLLNATTRATSREAAIWAVHLLYDRRLVPKLIHIMLDAREDPAVRGQAAEALAPFRSPIVARALRNALAVQIAEVRFFAAHSLASAGTVDAISDLEAVVNDESQTQYGSVRDEVLEAIAMIRQGSGHQPTRARRIR